MDTGHDGRSDEEQMTVWIQNMTDDRTEDQVDTGHDGQSDGGTELRMVSGHDRLSDGGTADGMDTGHDGRSDRSTDGSMDGYRTRRTIGRRYRSQDMTDDRTRNSSLYG